MSGGCVALNAKHRTLRLGFAILAVLVVCRGAWSDSFVNGGFETTSPQWDGWVDAGGTWEASTSPPYTTEITSNKDPDKSAIITDNTAKDPNTNDQLYEVYTGNDSARVNNYDNGYHFSTISQTVADWEGTEAGGNKLYFAWAAVLQEPSNEHPAQAAPHFEVSVFDDTLHESLYDVAFNVYDADQEGITWYSGATDGNGTWKYSQWVPVALNMSTVLGDTITMTVSAYDCGWGGHGGYAYVDDFGPTPSTPNEGVSVQQTLYDNATPNGSTPEIPPLLLLGACAPVASALVRRRRRRKR